MLQQQEDFFLPSMELITAAAQPTPERTWSASAGQFLEQAPHSMHASLFAISALPFVRPKTACGQTFKHTPHPTHFFSLMLNVTTSRR